MRPSQNGPRDKILAQPCAKRWYHWKRTLENYLRRIDIIYAEDKLHVLISFDTSVYTYIRECASYQLSQSTKCMLSIN